MTNDDRTNADRPGDGQVPNWGGAPQQQPAAGADEPRYGERVDPAPQFGQQQYGQQDAQPQYGQTPQYGGQQQYGQQHGGAQPYAAAAAPSSAPTWQSYDEPPAKKKTVGVIAFLVAVLALVAGIVSGVMLGTVFGGSEAFRNSLENGGTTPSDSEIIALSSSAGALGASVLFYVGTGLGIWAIVQGIVAAVTKRGRAWGVWAIVVAVVASIAFFIAMIAALVSASGAAGV